MSTRFAEAGIALFLLGVTIWSLFDGSASFARVRFERAVDPLSYWIVVGLYFLLSLGCFYQVAGSFFG